MTKSGATDMLNKDNIDQLLLKHLLQENAVEEEQLLKEWLGHDPEHQRYFERFRRHHIHLQAAIQSGRIQGQYIEFASRLKRRHIRRLFPDFVIAYPKILRQRV